MPANDLFDLEPMHRLQVEAAALAAELSAAAQAAAGVFTGRDTAGTVEVTVAGDGVPTGVQVSAAWRRAVGGEGLGAAVVAALNSAAEARLTAWAAGMGRPGNAVGPDRPAEVGRDALGDPSSRQSQLALRELYDVIGAVTQQLPAFTRAVEDAAARAVVSTNALRTVRVTAVGATVTGIDVDDQWLRTAEPDRIGAGLCEALVASGRDYAVAKGRATAGGPEVERLRRLTGSPEDLLREIGLLR